MLEIDIEEQSIHRKRTNHTLEKQTITFSEYLTNMQTGQEAPPAG